jgi:hypothetical protein
MSRKTELLQKVFDRLDGNRDEYGDLCAEIEAELANPEQEPIGYVNPDHIDDLNRRSARIWKERSDNGITMPLYTSPRPMQRLTDEEIESRMSAIWPDMCEQGIKATHGFARTIETTLIEKNSAQAQADNPIIENIKAAIYDFYTALDRREHGGVAMNIAFRKIEEAIGFRWKQEETLIEKNNGLP